jgi:protein-disulfide isomerase
VLRVELGSAPVRGPADAPVTIVEYADYECGFCARADTTLKQLEAEFPGKIRVAWKDFPLPFHASARTAAIAARAAGAQGRFWELHDKLLAHAGELDRAHSEQYAQELGLDLGRLRGALDAGGALGEGVDADVAEGKRLGVRGTPTFFVNGVAVTGAQPIDVMRGQVKAALLRAQAVLDGGARPDEVYAKIIQAGRSSPPPVQVADEAPRPRQAVAVGDAPVRGPEGAAVTLVVFSDFECPFCAKMAQTLKELEGELGGRVRIAHKNMPLPFHPHAEPAARAALAAGQQGRFWEMHDRLFGTPASSRTQSFCSTRPRSGWTWRASARTSGRPRSASGSSAIGSRPRRSGSPARRRCSSTVSSWPGRSRSPRCAPPSRRSCAGAGARGRRR